MITISIISDTASNTPTISTIVGTGSSTTPHHIPQNHSPRRLFTHADDVAVSCAIEDSNVGRDRLAFISKLERFCERTHIANNGHQHQTHTHTHTLTHTHTHTHSISRHLPRGIDAHCGSDSAWRLHATLPNTDPCLNRT